MKLAVFSDAHHNIETMKSSVKELENIDYLIYAGDGLDKILASEIPEKFNLLAVPGNCDNIADYPKERIIDWGDVKIFLTHGKRYRIKWGLDNLYYKAQEVEADIVIFGHTHCRYAEKKNNILFFNPGSISQPRDNKEPSYGLLEIKNSEIKYEHIESVSNKN